MNPHPIDEAWVLEQLDDGVDPDLLTDTRPDEKSEAIAMIKEHFGPVRASTAAEMWDDEPPASVPPAPPVAPAPARTEPSHDVEEEPGPFPEPAASAAAPVHTAPAPPNITVARSRLKYAVYELEAVAKRLADIDSTKVIAAMSMDQRRAYAEQMRGVSQVIDEWVADLLAETADASDQSPAAA
jgi:hypothetical protein